MDFFQLLFFFLVSIIFVSAIITISAKNPINSLLFLILVFVNVVILLLFLKTDFLAMLFLMVYVGAVAVLFLFVLIRILLDQISGIKLILSGDRKGYLSIVKAHLSYLTSIGKMNVKRKQFSKLNFHKLKGYSNKSTIWNYFFLKKFC